ncbi:uncharacterized protein ASCRUDRAFT_89055 [Ascoidea rubescens DSM 1968]|uniref:Uncharacterized protein n=1 Tax=Ascoidea rubescens DSM 1968 TaxID=1344418 RepID=A0A1D2VPN2_9ASCO|nr:hypothetical protein ASCRUDRAFT_89055 [Ascoidea rubescens DSM 1968]ODV63571.1 hypothetical protein ASCRUDRAFT_89055 [Ascoidea rubescens DSM 1968]
MSSNLKNDIISLSSLNNLNNLLKNSSSLNNLNQFQSQFHNQNQNQIQIQSSNPNSISNSNSTSHSRSHSRSRSYSHSHSRSYSHSRSQSISISNHSMKRDLSIVSKKSLLSQYSERPLSANFLNNDDLNSQNIIDDELLYKSLTNKSLNSKLNLINDTSNISLNESLLFSKSSKSIMSPSDNIKLNQLIDRNSNFLPKSNKSNPQNLSNLSNSSNLTDTDHEIDYIHNILISKSNKKPFSTSASNPHSISISNNKLAFSSISKSNSNSNSISNSNLIINTNANKKIQQSSTSSFIVQLIDKSFKDINPSIDLTTSNHNISIPNSNETNLYDILEESSLKNYISKSDRNDILLAYNNSLENLPLSKKNPSVSPSAQLRSFHLSKKTKEKSQRSRRFAQDHSESIRLFNLYDKFSNQPAKSLKLKSSLKLLQKKSSKSSLSEKKSKKLKNSDKKSDLSNENDNSSTEVLENQRDQKSFVELVPSKISTSRSDGNVVRFLENDFSDITDEVAKENVCKNIAYHDQQHNHNDVVDTKASHSSNPHRIRRSLPENDEIQNIKKKSNFVRFLIKEDEGDELKTSSSKKTYIFNSIHENKSNDSFGNKSSQSQSLINSFPVQRRVSSRKISKKIKHKPSILSIFSNRSNETSNVTFKNLNNDFEYYDSTRNRMSSRVYRKSGALLIDKNRREIMEKQEFDKDNKAKKVVRRKKSIFDRNETNLKTTVKSSGKFQDQSEMGTTYLTVTDGLDSTIYDTSFLIADSSFIKKSASTKSIQSLLKIKNTLNILPNSFSLKSIDKVLHKKDKKVEGTEFKQFL